ncbi:MAG: hypothetical protein LUG91_06180 [Ruminococcus sp.]|nr:hypothetical protein [Ruminococcus sp.]
MKGKGNPSNGLHKEGLREKYISEGFESLSDTEIVELILSCSSNDDNIAETARELIRQYGTYYALPDADIPDLRKRFGLSDNTIALFKLVPQLSKIYFRDDGKAPMLSSTAAAIKFFESCFIGALDEEAAAVCTDDSFNVIGSVMIFKGSINSVNLSCRKAADYAMQNNSHRIFIAHNHPSGSAAPSANDYNATNMIFNILRALGIHLIDHIVVGKQSAVSMRELPYTLPFKKDESFGYIISSEK